MIAPQRATVLAAPLAGLQAQATGLAEAMGFVAVPEALEARGVWRHVPPALWPRPLAALSRQPVNPASLVIGAGGMAGAVGAALRTGGRRVIQVQDPRMHPDRFDAIVVNAHDRLRAPNVVVVRTALHRATSVRLAAAAAAWAPAFATLPRPLVAVLVGGGNGRLVLDAATARRLARQIAAMMGGCGIVLTPSRRTAADAASVLAGLRERGAFVWDGSGENPYFGMLALADAILVTEDSISMVSEACATAAPVYVARLPGRSRKGRAFLDGLLAAGRIRIYEGRCDAFAAAPLDDTPRAAAEVRRLLHLE